jgi:cation diffusion facilitator family transporter
VALLNVLIKIYLTLYTQKLGRETHNTVVNAIAYDHRNDLFSASAVSVGIFLGQRGLPWVDPLAGALVAFLILQTGVYILRESSVDLMDAVPSKELAVQIADLIKEVHGVKQLEEVQAHRFGPHLVVNLTIGIDGGLTVSKGDAIASRVEHLLYDSVPNLRRVHVHYHPADKEHRNMTIDEILAEGRKQVAGEEDEE